MKYLFNGIFLSLICTQIVMFQLDFSYNKETHEDCKQNMTNYTLSDNSLSWICDCLADYLYYSETDSCYEPYRQGPCSQGHFLKLPIKESIAKCEKNPCLEDGLVFYQGSCYRLGTSGPACNDSFYLRVDNIDFELSCFQNQSIVADNSTSGVLRIEQEVDSEDTARHEHEKSFNSINKTFEICLHNVSSHLEEQNFITWICDNLPLILYFPENNSCYLGNDKNSCPIVLYVKFASDEVVAKCEKNVCLSEFPKKVVFMKQPPCDESSTYLKVEKELKNYNLTCNVLIDTIHFWGTPRKIEIYSPIITAPTKACKKGSKRIAHGVCKVLYQ